MHSLQTIKASVLMLLLLLGGCAQQPVEEASTPLAVYDWSASTNAIAELREQLGWSSDYDELCLHERPLETMVGAMHEGEWATAAAIGDAWLQQCPIDIRVHYYSGIALSQQGQTEQANLHFRWSDALMDAVAASGDGESCATAYVTVSLSEEYDAMELFGLLNDNAAPIDEGGTCDMFSVSDEDGFKSNIYFHASAQIARYAAICQSEPQFVSYSVNCN